MRKRKCLYQDSKEKELQVQKLKEGYTYEVVISVAGIT